MEWNAMSITVNGIEIDHFTRGYLIAALWSSNDESGSPLDSSYGLEDIHPDSLKGALEDCKDFQDRNADDLQQYEQLRAEKDSIKESGDTWMDYAGHDFWLTRNGHGAGFWDRSIGEVGERLSNSSKAYGEAYVYVGDDGKVHHA
jgi:hypothetical protein